MQLIILSIIILILGVQKYFKSNHSKALFKKGTVREIEITLMITIMQNSKKDR